MRGGRGPGWDNNECETEQSSEEESQVLLNAEESDLCTSQHAYLRRSKGPHLLIIVFIANDDCG